MHLTKQIITNRIFTYCECFDDNEPIKTDIIKIMRSFDLMINKHDYLICRTVSDVCSQKIKDMINYCWRDIVNMKKYEYVNIGRALHNCYYYGTYSVDMNTNIDIYCGMTCIYGTYYVETKKLIKLLLNGSIMAHQLYDKSNNSNNSFVSQHSLELKIQQIMSNNKLLDKLLLCYVCLARSEIVSDITIMIMQMLINII